MTTQATTIKISSNDLNKKVPVILGLLTAEEAKKGSQSKLLYALKRWNDQKTEFDKLVNNEVDEINIKLASTDQNGLLERGADGSYKYSIQNERQRSKELKELYDKKFPFTPYLFTSDQDRINSFGQYEKEELEGVFIPGKYTEKPDKPKSTKKP